MGKTYCAACGAATNESGCTGDMARHDNFVARFVPRGQAGQRMTDAYFSVLGVLYSRELDQNPDPRVAMARAHRKALGAAEAWEVVTRPKVPE